MLEMIWKPTLYGFDTCKEFAEAFRLNSDDLISMSPTSAVWRT